MKAKHKKRALQLDFIRQKENEASDKSNNKNKQSHNSGGSSDFSQFELQSKDINNEFTPFLKPKQWKKQSQRNQQLHKKTKKAKQREQHKEIKQLKQIHRNRKKQQKLKKQENQQHQQHQITKNKQKNKSDKTVSHIISFAKSPSNSKQSPQIDKFQSNRINKQSVNNQNDDQSLISEYDKRQFNDKSPKKQAEQYTKDLERSRKIQQQKQLKQNGVIEATGGICFQISKSDFVYQQQVKPKKMKKKARKIKYNQKVLGNSVTTNIQLMKRRERAFRYGQFIRRRTFGYY